MSDPLAILKRPSFTPGARSAGHIPLSKAEQAALDRDRYRQRMADYGPQMLTFIEKLKVFRAKWGTFTVDGPLFDRVVANGRYVSENDERTLISAKPVRSARLPSALPRPRQLRTSRSRATT